MVKDVENELLENMRNEIKGYIKMRGYTYEKLAKVMTKEYGESMTSQSLSNKLARGSIKFIDVIKIANVLDYKISWVQK